MIHFITTVYFSTKPYILINLFGHFAPRRQPEDTMNLLNMLLSKFHRLFMNMKLSHKLLLGYVIIILLPTITLEYSLYNQNYNSVLNQYIQNEKNALDIAQKNLNIQLNKIQESAEFLSSSTVLNSYLNGSYNTQSEELYYYIKDIQPLLGYLSKSDSALQNITFYGVNSYHLNWGGRLISTKESPLPDDLNRSVKDLINGVWYKEPGNTSTLTYYRCLYNRNYSAPVTTLRIDVSLADLMKNFSSLSGTILAHFDCDSQPLCYQNDTLEFVPSPVSGTNQDGISLCQTEISELNLNIIQALDIESSLNYNGNNLLFLLLLLFLVLSAGYYVITTSITARISALQNHIRQSKADNLVPLENASYKDEIGQLTTTYNQMVNRINDLLYQIYHTELEKRDAEFYALQAQIEPHFLYNILENIHMSAEQSGDSQTAAMVISLGKFMRYNLNSNTGFVHLDDELVHAKNYLDIHKIRMQEKLNIQIAVFTEIDDIMCPRFILQPLLENAIKHARIPSDPLNITLTVKNASDSETSSDVILEIHDNGQGITPETLKPIQDSLKKSTWPRASHIGLNSINNRLQAFYKNDHVMQIDSAPDQGTTVTLYLKRTGGNADENTCS